MIELRKLARSCNIGNFLEQALWDRFACGLANASLQKRILTERNLTLEKALSIVKAMEMAVLDSHGSKKAATSSHTEEDINRIAL